MKQHKKTDRIIRDKMEQYSTETPMHLFEGIMGALDIEATPVPKKKPWHRGWLFSLLALVLVSASTWYVFSGNEKIDISNEKLTASIDGKNQSTKNTTDNTVVNKTSTVANGNIINETQKTNTELIISNTAAETSTAQNNILNTTSTQKTTTNSNNNSNKSTTNNNIFTNTNISKKNNTNQSPNLFINNTSTSDVILMKDELREKGGAIENSNSTTQNQIFNSKTKTSSQNQNNTTASSIENTTVVSKNNKVIANRSTSSESVLYLPNLKTKHNLSRPITHNKIDVEPLCGLKPDGSKIRFTTSIDAFFSPDYAVQMLEYKSEDFKHHAEMRTKSESGYYSFNTGFRVNFLTEFDWALRTGIVYTQINDILKTTHKEVIIQFDSAGDTISISEGTRDVNIRNRYRMIDIPILIGYEVPMKRFKLNVNGGVYVNLQSKQSGAFFSPLEDKIVYFTEGHPDNYDIFRNNVGLSMFLGLGFNFDLGKRFKNTQLIIEPHTRFYPKSFTMKNYILNQKYLSTGVMIGLRRDL